MHYCCQNVCLSVRQDFSQREENLELDDYFKCDGAPSNSHSKPKK